MSVKEIFNLVCPECASDEDLSVEVPVWCNLTEDGTSINDDGEDAEWEDESPCRCSCGWLGKVSDATVMPVK